MSAETTQAGEYAAVWADTKVTQLLAGAPADFVVPEYGSTSWVQLAHGARLKWAAALYAAESWRRQEHERRRLDALAEEDPDAWFREVTADADRYASTMCRALAAAPTHDELQQRRRYRSAHVLTVSPGWGPAAIPGRPGWWRHHIDGRQVDLPYREMPAERRSAA